MVRALTIAAVLAMSGGSPAASVGGLAITVSGSAHQESRPVVGARVRVLDRAAGASGRVVAAETTDGNGEFQLTIPWRESFADRLGWVLTLEADDAAPRILRLEEYVGLEEPGRAWSLGAVELNQGCPLHGVVIAGAGDEARPLSKVGVVAWHPRFDRPWETRTDEEGRFLVPRLPEGGYVVGFDHPDWLPGREEIEASCDQGSPPHVVRLVKGSMVDVQILLEDGRAAVGAFVYSLPTPPTMSGWKWLDVPTYTADEGGRVTVPVGPVGAPWIIVGHHPGSITTVAKRRAGQSSPRDRLLSLTLKSARRIRGRVRDEVDRNLEEVVVTIERLAAEDQPRSVAVASTDRYGQFDSGPLPTGFYRVRLSAEGYATMERTVLVSESIGRPALLDVELQALDTTTAVFEVTASRGPMEGVEVEVHSLESGGWLPGCATDPEGRCRVSGLPVDERLVILARHPGFDTQREYVEGLEPGEIYSLSLAQPVWNLVTVEGRIEGASGEPIPGARVRLTKPSEHSSVERQGWSGLDGRFVIADVPEGGYALEASAEGWAPAIVALRVEAGLEPLPLRLVRGARVTGRLAGADAEELHTARKVLVRWPQTVSSECSLDIWFMGPQGFPEPENGEIEGTNYRVDRLPPGEWTLVTFDDPPWSAQVFVDQDDLELVVDLFRPDPAACRQTEKGSRAPTTARPKSTPAEGVSAGQQKLEYSIEYADGLLLHDCLALELVDGSGSLVHEDDCADARGTWTDLPEGDFVLRWTEAEWNGWSVRLPSAPRTFAVPLTGILQLEVPALELTYRGGPGFARGLAVTLSPIGEDSRKPVTASDRIYFGLVPSGWWSVRAELDGEVWSEVVEIQPRQTHTLLLR